MRLPFPARRRPWSPLLAPGLLGLLGLPGLLACSRPAAAPTPPTAPPAASAPPAQTCSPPADPATGPVFLQDEAETRPRLLSFSPDGRWLAVADETNKVQLRDAFTGEQLIELDPHITPDPRWGSSRQAFRLDWSPTSKQLGLYFYGQICLWDLRTAPGPASAPAGQAPAGSLTAEASVVSLQEQKQIQRTNPESGILLGSAPVPHATPDARATLLFTWPLALGVATISGATVVARNSLTLETIGTYSIDPDSTYSVSPDNRTVLVIDASATMLIDVASGRVVLDHGRSLGKPLRSVQFVEQAFDHASPRAAILHQWNERSYGVDVFDLAEHKLLRQLSVNGWSERRPPEFSAHERGRIFTPGEGRRDLAWSLDTGKQIGPRLPPKPTNSEGVPSPDGRLVARTDVGRVLVSEKATGQPLWSLPHGGGVTPVQRAITSPDGQQLALVPGGKTRKFLLLRPGEGKVSFGLPDPRSDIAGIAFGPVGSTFASFSQQTGKLTFWNPQTLEPWGDESVGRGVQSARWSPDGRLLAVTDLDGALTLWTDRTPRTLPLPGLAVSDLRFTDDSAHLIGIGRDGALMAWSTASAWPTGPWDFGLGARFELTASTEDEISHEIVVHSPSTSEIVFLDFLTGATRRLPDCLPGDHATALGLHGRRRSLLLAAGNSPGALCDLDGKLVARLAAGEGGLRTAAAYDPSGRRVATVGEAGTGSVVRVRHTTTGNILFELPFPENKPSSLDLAFTSTALMVRREQGTSFHPLRDCSALDLRLIERQDALGWLVTDGAGHFDGNRAGRESVWVQGPSTQRVEHLGRVEQEKHRVEGLLFGVRLFSCTNRGRPPEDEP